MTNRFTLPHPRPPHTIPAYRNAGERYTSDIALTYAQMEWLLDAAEKFDRAHRRLMGHPTYRVPSPDFLDAFIYSIWPLPIKQPDRGVILGHNIAVI
jgi:hypothetical protein